MVLSACGGSSGGDSGGLQLVPGPSIPTSGSATYTGDLNFVLNEGGAGNVTYTGDLTVNANFSGSTVTGNATGFSDTDSESYTGTLTLQNGDIDRNLPSNLFPLFADLDGTLTRVSDGTTYTSGAAIGADFYQSDGATTPEEIRGRVSGTFQKDDGVTAPTTIAVEETLSTFTASQ